MDLCTPSLASLAIDTAVAAYMAGVLHELKRARIAPVFHVTGGQVRTYQDTALTWGWVTANPYDHHRLMLTARGREVLQHYQAKGL